MAVIGEFTVPAGSFVMGEALESHPDVRVELDQVVPTRRRSVPFFWARDGDLDAFAATARELPTVASLDAVDAADDRRLYRVEWDGGATPLGRALRTADATVTEATGRRETWAFELRFGSHGDVRTFQTDCNDRGVPLELERLQPLADRADDGYDLTPEQRETLEAALERGYFNEPRDVTLEELAEGLGLSPTAVSGRMRRAEAKIVARTLADDT